MTDARPQRVGLLAPMPSEMKPLATALALQPDAKKDVYRGSIAGIELIATKTGIGTQRATDAAERLLDLADVDHVIVCGIAGGMGPSKVGEVFFPEIVVDKATRTEYRSAPLGGVVPTGKLVTHDDFDMGPDEANALIGEGFIAVDMETSAVAAVCEKRAVPWSAVRAISDLVGVTPGDVIDLANADGTPNIGASLKYLVTKPQRIPYLVKLGRDSVKAANAAAAGARQSLLG
jgi:nucleoside phosphorylase